MTYAEILILPHVCWRYFAWDNLPSFLPDPITMKLQRSSVRTESWQVRSDKGPTGGRTFVRSYRSRRQFCSHTSSLLDRGNHNHRLRSGMLIPVTLSCKSSWITPGKIRENPQLPILNLRFEAELSHKHWLRGKNYRCKGLVWQWEAERAINLCEAELLLLPSSSNPAVQRCFLSFGGFFKAVPYPWMHWARQASWVEATK